MTEYMLPHFGKLPTGNLEEYYDAEIEMNGSEIQIDLNFENKTIDIATLDKVKEFIHHIDKFDRTNKTYMLNDYNSEDGDTVRLYLEHHIHEVSRDELSTLIDFDDRSTEPEQQLFSKLGLVRIGLYPDSDDNFATFDYSIGQDITDYLIVISTNADGEPDYMTMES